MLLFVLELHQNLNRFGQKLILRKNSHLSLIFNSESSDDLTMMCFLFIFIFVSVIVVWGIETASIFPKVSCSIFGT